MTDLKLVSNNYEFYGYRSERELLNCPEAFYVKVFAKDFDDAEIKIKEKSKPHANFIIQLTDSGYLND
jgi:hypothetical protein